jgi:hypothetical protein
MNNGQEDHIIHRSKDKQTLLKKYDIPIEFLSYEYIGECKKSKELERIVRILRYVTVYIFIYIICSLFHGEFLS